MPKASLVDGKALASLIAEYKSSVFNNLGEICGPTATVWETIQTAVKSAFGKDVSTFYLYAFVKQGRHGLLELLGNHCSGSQSPSPSRIATARKSTIGVSTPSHASTTANVSIGSSSEEPGSFSSADHSPSAVSDADSFSFAITRIQWDKIGPIEKSFPRSDRKNAQIRRYWAMQPGWSDLFSTRIWDVTKKPCCWSFKRSADIRPSGSFYLVANAYCRECLCNLCVRLSADPSASQHHVKFHCTISGYVEEAHACKAKRHLTGEARANLGAALLDRNIAASTYRKQQASCMMQMGDDDPPILPNMTVMRRAKLDIKKSAQLDPNPALALFEAKYSPLLQGSIKDVAIDRFYCHYWSAQQMQVYQLYCKNEASVLLLDATGGIAHRLKKPNGGKGGNIFLYEGVIKCARADQVSVVQMLSERHDSAGISFWLSSWLRDGAPIPKQTVTDMSLALIGAIVRAFTSQPHLQAYVDSLWRVAHHEQESLPECHLRVDVAHFIKRAASWKSLNSGSTNRRVKDFYLRCIGQLVLSSKLSTAELIIKALITVARSETNGKQTPSGSQSLCEGRKQFLKTIIAKGFPASLENQLSTFTCETAAAYSSTSFVDGSDDDDNDLSAIPTSFGAWVEQLDISCQQALSTEIESDDANACWNPAFVADLKRVSRLLPLGAGS